MSGVAAARELVSADAGVSALVGDRVYRTVPRGTCLPYVRIIRSDVDWNATLDGTTNRLVMETIDVDSVAATAAQATALDAAVRAALQDACELVAAGVTVAAVVIEGGAENVTPPDHGDDLQVCTISQAYLIQWRS